MSAGVSKAQALRGHLKALGIELTILQAQAALAHVAKTRGAPTNEAAVNGGIATTLAIIDAAGAEIERAEFPSEAEAADAAAEFIRASADARWAEDGAALPSPASYTILLDYKNGGETRTLPAAAGVKDEDGATLLSTCIADWRIAEGEPEELPPHQRRHWDVAVQRVSYGDLLLALTPPEGDRFEITVEIDRGNVQLRPVRPHHGDPDAIITICDETTHVAPMTSPAGALPAAVTVDERGIVAAGSEPRASRR